MLKHSTKLSLLINGFSILKLPLLAFASPRVVEASEKKSVVKVALGWRTQNHLGVMYFGALAMGAELSIALKAVEKIGSEKLRVDFIFKDFKCEFLKRADSDVLFICEEADQVTALIEKAKNSTERLERKFKGYAVRVNDTAAPVMTYELTLSVKNRAAGLKK